MWVIQVVKRVCPCCGEKRTVRDKTNKRVFRPVCMDDTKQHKIMVCKNCAGCDLKDRFIETHKLRVTALRERHMAQVVLWPTTLLSDVCA